MAMFPIILDFSEAEHRLLCSSEDPIRKDLAHGAKLAQQWGYDEVNLNCGCPSERVQKGSFGACLMAEPGLVADCVKAMQDATHSPVTIKHRVGIDANNDYGFVRDFVGTLFNAGVRVFIVHARNAWLKGLSPKENREIPPLRREVVYQLKKDFPEAIIVINGALQDLGECEAELKHVERRYAGSSRLLHTRGFSLMLMPAFTTTNTLPVTRDRVIDAMEEYVRFIKPDDHSLRACCRHMHGLLTGLAGAKVWRRTLSDTALIREQGADIPLCLRQSRLGRC